MNDKPSNYFHMTMGLWSWISLMWLALHNKFKHVQELSKTLQDTSELSMGHVIIGFWLLIMWLWTIIEIYDKNFNNK